MNRLLIFPVIGLLLLTCCNTIPTFHNYTDNNIIINQEITQTDQSLIQTNDEPCQGYMICSIVPFMLLGEGHYSLLIDMNGTPIKTWHTIPDPVKMLPGGSIISATGEYIDSWDSTHLTQLSWNGSIEWDFSGWDDDGTGTLMAREHHDFQREGNPVGYYAPGQDFLPQGKTLILGHKNIVNKNVSWRPIIDDVIYEVNWNDTLTGFEWHTSDHIDQMGFTEMQRKGIWLNPGGPGLILGTLPGDWIHINSVSLLGKNKWYDAGDERFNPENIIISSRHGSFIAIIDRETGDIIWRIGPDYSKDTLEGQKLGKLIGLHNAHLIPDGLPGAGNILLFDNGGLAGYGFLGFPQMFRLYSRVVEFNPMTLDIQQEYMDKTGIIRLVRDGEYHRFYSPTLCNVQRLPNGNTLVSEGLSGRIFEINPENTIVWSWKTPDPKDFIYRAYRVPPEWIPGNPSGYESWDALYN